MIGSSQDQKCSSQIAFDNLFQSVYRGQVLQMVYGGPLKIALD